MEKGIIKRPHYYKCTTNYKSSNLHTCNEWTEDIKEKYFIKSSNNKIYNTSQNTNKKFTKPTERKTHFIQRYKARADLI